MARKVEINYSKVKEISDLGLSVKDTLERLHQCNINISRMQYYRWQKNNVTSKEDDNVTLNDSKNNVTSNHLNNYVTSKKDDNVTSKGRYEVVGLGLNNRTELKGKRFDTIEEITSIGIDEIFIYDYNEGRCLSREYIAKAKPFLPFDWK